MGTGRTSQSRERQKERVCRQNTGIGGHFRTIGKHGAVEISWNLTG